MTILPFRKQKMSTNGIKPPLTQEELAELFEEAEVWKLGLNCTPKVRQKKSNF